MQRQEDSDLERIRGWLRSDRAGGRFRAVVALSQINPPTPEVVDLLASALEDERLEVRLLATTVLGEIGLAAASSTDALRQRLAVDESPKVRTYAAYALSRIDRTGATCRELTEGLLDADPQVRRAAGAALLRMVETVPDVVAVSTREIASLLSEKTDLLLLPLIAMILAALGGRAQVAVPELVTLARSDNRYMRLLAARALQSVSPSDLPATLKEEANGADANLDLDFIDAMGVTTSLPYTRTDLPDLERHLTSPDTDRRKTAAFAVARLGHVGTSAVDLLASMLDQTGPGERMGSAFALGAIGPAASATVPKLIHLHADPLEGVRRLAGFGLKSVDAVGPEDVRRLKHLLVRSMYAPTAGPQQVAIALAQDPWLLAEYEKIADRYRSRYPSHFSESSEELLGDFFAWLFERRLMRDRTLNFHPSRHGEIAGWLTTIFRNYLRNERKRRIRQRGLLVDTGKFDRIAGAASDPSLRDRVDMVLVTLPAEEAAAVRLVYMEGYTYDEAAEQMGVSITQVDTLLRRAKRRFR